jgi:hypothetical protein
MIKDYDLSQAKSLNKVFACREHSHQCVIEREGTIAERVNSHKAKSRLVWRYPQQSRSFCQEVQRPPRLIPLFPVGNYTPQSRCGHHGPIQPGSLFCCMICHRSGHDHHPALREVSSSSLSCNEKNYERYPNAPFSGKPNLETRRERRQRLFRIFSHWTRNEDRPALIEMEPSKKSNLALCRRTVSSPRLSPCVKINGSSADFMGKKRP